jgi:hypothetical protein
MQNFLNGFDINVIKGKKVLIGTPTYENHVMINYHQSIMDLFFYAKEYNINIKHFLGTHDSLIPRMRNKIIKVFIENDFDYLFFIDSDISFNPQDIFHMLYLSETTEMKVIVGAYPKKDISWNQVDIAIKNNLIKNSNDIKKYSSEFGINFKNNTVFDKDKPFEIEQGSTGFMLISKNVIKDFFKNYPDQVGQDYDGNPDYVCFQSILDKETNVFLSEDYYFCNMIKKINHKVWLLPYVSLDHLGTTTFSGSFINYIENSENTNITDNS